MSNFFNLVDLPGETISEIASTNDNFDILTAFLDLTSLRLTTALPGDFTVFAPTDDAFKTLATETLGLDISFEGKSDRKIGFEIYDAIGGHLAHQVILYHLIDGSLTTEELDGAGALQTLQGGTLRVDGNEVIDQDPDVVNPLFVTGLTNIDANNGTVQVIDRVLLPIDIVEAPVDEPTIAEIASGNANFSILVEALSQAGLVGAVADPDANLTVFAPTNAAFADLAVNTLGLDIDGLSDQQIVSALIDAAGVELVTDILLYHVKAGESRLGELREDGTFTTLQGGQITIDGRELIDLDPDAGNPFVISELKNIDAGNGIIQAIDKVLLPVDLPALGGVELEGTSGDDLLRGTLQDDILKGRSGDDTLRGRDGDDLLLGRAGADKLFGAEGNDTLKGNKGADSLFGGEGDDVVRGGKENDELGGGMGADMLTGGQGHDTLRGGEGDDVLKGGKGQDVLVAGGGNDELRGGGGADMFEFMTLVGDDTIKGFSHSDTIVFSTDLFADFSAVQAASTLSGNQTVIVSEGGSLTVNGSDLAADDFVFV